MNILSLLNMQIIGKKQQKENKGEKFDTVGALYSSDAFMDSYDGQNVIGVKIVFIIKSF